MAFTAELHLEADSLRNQINSINNKIATFNNIKNENRSGLKLVYVDDNGDTKSTSISDDATATNALLDEVIANLETDLTSLETQYEEICSSGEGE